MSNLIAKMALKQLVSYMKEKNMSCMKVFLTESNEVDFMPVHAPDDLILKSDRIYLTMNLHDEIRKETFLNKIKEDFVITILDEYPKTHWPNYIIIGNKK
jgi:hypothetical protein